MESGEDEQAALSTLSPVRNGRLSFGATSGEDPDDRDEEGCGTDGFQRQSDGLALFPSAGSVAHGTGVCRPCAFFWKQRGCKDGQNCTHCHLCPQGEIRARRMSKLQALQPERRVPAPALLEPRKVASSLLPLGPPPRRRPGDEPALAEEALPPEQPAIDLSETPSSDEDGEVDTSGVDIQVQPARWSFSIGSVMHGTGECKPCAWFWKPQGCQNGEDCRHCHLCPIGEIRERKRKSKARRTGAAPPPPPAPEPALLPGLAQLPLPSVGSAWHGLGLCRPCAWFWKPQGCGNAERCQHCHLCPEGAIKARKKLKLACLRQEAPAIYPDGSALDVTAWLSFGALPLLPSMTMRPSTLSAT